MAYTTAFCSNGDHLLCKGGTSHAECACSCGHTGRRCIDCGEPVYVGTWCEDLVACQERVAAHPTVRLLREWAAASASVRVERRTGSARSPRDCECGCGSRTGGGRFLPGHDAKLKSRLRKAGTVEAYAELIRRGWHRPDRDGVDDDFLRDAYELAAS